MHEIETLCTTSNILCDSVGTMYIHGQHGSINSVSADTKLDSVLLSETVCHLLVMGKSSCTMLLGERLPSKIHTIDPFEVVPEPNIVAHITELNSHFPWQQKTERKHKTEERGKQPFRAI